MVPDDLPFCTGTIGMIGTQASDAMMKECDTLLMIGSSFPYAEFLPREGSAKAVQIDVDATMLGLAALLVSAAYKIAVYEDRRRAKAPSLPRSAGTNRLAALEAGE